MHVVTKKLAFLDLTQSTEGFALQIIISQLKLMFIVILGVIQIFIVILGVIQKKIIINGYQTYHLVNITSLCMMIQN